MKKSLSILITSLLLVGSFNICAVASTKDDDYELYQEIRKTFKVNMDYEKLTLNSKDLTKKLESIADEYSKNKKVTDEDHKKALEKAKLVEDIFSDAKVSENKDISLQSSTLVTATSTSTYDANKARLRQANFIEGILNVDEGLSSTDIYKIGYTLANNARDTAKAQYPTNEMMQDAYRHFLWNHLGTRDSSIGETKIKIATINHEWGLIELTPMLNYYDSQYNKYIAQGLSSSTAADKAFADTVLYITDFKYMTRTACIRDYGFFSALMSVSNIMDFTNNSEGRFYARMYPSKTGYSAFLAAVNDNAVIKSESLVDATRRQRLWTLQVY